MDNPHSDPNHAQKYVVAFAFWGNSVVLIEKMKPAWQKGKMNGVGGKIEPGEAPLHAMRREFLEETGVDVHDVGWHLFHVMRFRNGVEVWCYTSDISRAPSHPRTMEEEHVRMCPVNDYGRLVMNPYSIVPNLNWLIPMAWHELHEAPIERMVIR